MLNSFVITDLALPTGSSTELFAAGVAEYVQNFVPSPIGGLRSVQLPADYEPNPTPFFPLTDSVRAICYAPFSNGAAGLLLVSGGGRVQVHQSWARRWVTVVSDLSPSADVGYPEHFIAFDSYVVWTNGQDQPLALDDEGQASVLGFDRAPSAPLVDGPSSPDEDRDLRYYPNSMGYSWPGQIGTQLDVLGARQGKIAKGLWQYAIQYVDKFNNLSPLSPLSNTVSIDEIVTSAVDFRHNSVTGNDELDNTSHGAHLDQLTRQFFLRVPAIDTPNAVGYLVSRTKDIKRNPRTLYAIDRHYGCGAMSLPDNTDDALLGQPAADVLPMPPFKVGIAHGGRLVIGNCPGYPGRVYESLPGQPGTIDATSWVQPDKGGAPITGLASHQGRRYAFTATGCYDITDFSLPPVLVAGYGCCAPQSVQSLPSGHLVWRSSAGWFAWEPGQAPFNISESLRDWIATNLSNQRAGMSISAVHPDTKQYLCTVCRAGKMEPDLIMAWHPLIGWSFLDFTYPVLALHTPSVGNIYLQGCRSGTDGVLRVGNRSTPSEGMPMQAIYRTAWLRADNAGIKRFYAKQLVVTYVETSNQSITINYRVDMSDAVVQSTTCILTDAPLATEATPYIAATSTVGNAYWRNGRVVSRILPIERANIRALQIEIVGDLSNKDVWLIGLTLLSTGPTVATTVGRTQMQLSGTD